MPFFDGGSYASPDSWQAADRGFGYTSDDTSVQGVNKFQAATCPGGSTLVAPGCYAPFTTTAPGDVVADHDSGVTGTPISNETFTMTYRFTVNADHPAGTYAVVAVLSNTATY